MLTHLVIRNLAIIDTLELPFSDGFTALTGETGAGKSIIINALNLLLGGRANTDLVRSSADEASVEGIFELEGELKERINRNLTLRGVEVGEQLIIRRILSRSGRNKVFINGSAARVSVLRELTRGLVDISGQHEHYSLLDAMVHVDYLDTFAGLQEDRKGIEEAIQKLRALSNEVKSLQGGERARLTQIDFLRFQLGEIDDAALSPEEEEDLLQECKRLQNAEHLSEVSRGVCYALYESESAAVDLVATACGDLEKAARMDENLLPIVEGLESARIQLEEATNDLRYYAEEIEADPRRLLYVTDRLNLIEKLKRKHGESVGVVLECAEEMRAELEELEGAEVRVEEVLREMTQVQRVVLSQARTLSVRRKKAARRLESLIEDELSELGMGGCLFRVQILHVDEEGNPTEDAARASAASLGAHGIDQVEFLIAPNRGEPPRSMAAIASGGELSRIMLAIKNVLLRDDPVGTYIFDEVDTGIGGRTAEVVGRKIKQVARRRQVLCITHLAQIASFADEHMVVKKVHHPDRTVSSVRRLNHEDRVAEVARMIGGLTMTQKTLDHAEEMIREARGGEGS